MSAEPILVGRRGGREAHLPSKVPRCAMVYARQNAHLRRARGSGMGTTSEGADTDTPAIVMFRI